eukprot:CAMPEP_0183793310 /NCGR_PEP_ID=MMETSP0803_2-20130417/3131_1 /TAXON_ID=195967 /ORGANISM="Crustomastix stigmata, Strain CCMP3273" /LENGTH=188 /DNA_ID=CAMNT_0026037685 /DNA_START=54 /DNA_END=620 /DNA_ORIENTATION=+
MATLRARTPAVSARRTRSVRRSARSQVRCAAEAEAEVTYCAVDDVKDHEDRGFVFVDIRSFEEMKETGGWRHTWEQIPLAAMTPDGDIVGNPNFLATIKAKFPNSMSRILLVCDDGSDRSEIAYEMITEKLGYSQVKVVEGGMDAYLEKFPLTQKDKVKVSMVGGNQGPDTSALLHGVDTRQAGQKFM